MLQAVKVRTATGAPVQVENPFAGMSGPAVTTPANPSAGPRDTLLVGSVTLVEPN